MKALAESYTNENDANRKHKLNMEHHDESQKCIRIFLINTSKKVAEIQSKKKRILKESSNMFFLH